MVEPALDVLWYVLKKKYKPEFRRQFEVLPLCEMMDLDFQEILRFVYWWFALRGYFNGWI